VTKIRGNGSIRGKKKAGNRLLAWKGKKRRD